MTILWYSELLQCPDCGAILSSQSGVLCEACGHAQPHAKPLDLRPKKNREVTLSFPTCTASMKVLETIDISRPTVAYRGPKAERDSSELFSAAMSLMPSEVKLLDLGCGPRDQAIVAEHFGWRYVGIDYDNPAADLLADAHSLPFQSDSFDAIISYAVFEHLSNPFVAVREAHRVLSPSGLFFGTVSLGEPFHNSFFHHTAWGVVSLLHSADFEILRLWPSYDTLRALADMGRYSKLVKWMLLAADVVNRRMPFLTPRKCFQWTQREKDMDALHRAGSVCFLARRRS